MQVPMKEHTEVLRKIQDSYDKKQYLTVIQLCDLYKRSLPPVVTDLKVLKAKALGKMGQYEASARLCEEIMDAVPFPNFNTLLECGFILLSCGYFEECANLVSIIYGRYKQLCIDHSNVFSILARQSGRVNILFKIEASKTDLDREYNDPTCQDYAALVWFSKLNHVDQTIPKQFVDKAELFLSRHLDVYLKEKLYDFIFLYAEILRIQNKSKECISLIETQMSNIKYMPVLSNGEYLFEVKEQFSDDKDILNDLLEVALRTKKHKYFSKYVKKVIDVFKETRSISIVNKALSKLDDIVKVSKGGFACMVTLFRYQLVFSLSSVDVIPEIPEYSDTLLDNIFSRIDDSNLYMHFSPCLNDMSRSQLLTFKEEFLKRIKDVTIDLLDKKEFYRSMNIAKFTFAMSQTDPDFLEKGAHSQITRVIKAYTSLAHSEALIHINGGPKEGHIEEICTRLEELCLMSVEFIIFEYYHSRDKLDLIFLCITLITVHPSFKTNRRLTATLATLLGYLGSFDSLYEAYSNLQIKNILIDTFGYTLLDLADICICPDKCLDIYNSVDSFYRFCDLVNSELLESLFRKTSYIQVKSFHRASHMLKYSIQRSHTRVQLIRSKLLLGACSQTNFIDFIKDRIGKIKNKIVPNESLCDNRVRSSLNSTILGKNVSLEEMLYGEPYPILRSPHWVQFYYNFLNLIVSIDDHITPNGEMKIDHIVLSRFKTSIESIANAIDSGTSQYTDDDNSYDVRIHGTHPKVFGIMAKAACMALELELDTIIAFSSMSEISKEDYSIRTHSIIEKIRVLIKYVYLCSIKDNSGKTTPIWSTNLCISLLLECVALLRLMSISLCKLVGQIPNYIQYYAIAYTDMFKSFRSLVKDVISEVRHCLKTLFECDTDILDAKPFTDAPFYKEESKLTSEMLKLSVGKPLLQEYRSKVTAIKKEWTIIRTYSLDFLSFNLDKCFAFT